MTPQQQNYQQWAECYTDELTYAEHQKAQAQAFDAEKFNMKDGKLERNQEELQTARSINDTLKQRGSVYGSFEAQAKCVGRIIKACNDVSMQNHEQALANIQLGSIAYIAIKLARFANGETSDTLHDLHGYSKLIDELYNGDKNV